MMELFLQLSTIIVSILSFTSADCTLPEEAKNIEGVRLVEDKASYNLWESVLFECSDGYEPLLQDFTPFCTEQGVFDPDPVIFNCLKTCSPPTLEDDTSFTDSHGNSEPTEVYQAYQVVEFACSDDVSVGYLEEDVQPLAYCSSNGEWEPSVFPDCKVSCTVPSLQNDTMYGSPSPQETIGYISHNTSITYECIDSIPGGILQGPMETTCDDGQFNDPTIPDCKVSCESPSGLVPSGVTDHGIEVNFTCGTTGGLIQDGNAVKCEDGHWSKDPVCSFLCPGRSEYYRPLNDVSTSMREKRSLDTSTLQETPFSDDRLVTSITAGVVAMVTTTSAVGFVTVAMKFGEHFSEVL